MKSRFKSLATPACLAIACLAPACAEPDPCRDVDLLFVIDNSPSMGENVPNIVAAAPMLAEALVGAAGKQIQPHVGVVTSDAYAGNAQGCQTLGALVTRTAGGAATVRECGPFRSEARFLGPQDDVAAGLSCMLQVGASGAVDEDLFGAAVAAVGPTLGADGACNEGFVRPGSMLVVTVVTDEDLGVPAASMGPVQTGPANPTTAPVRPRLDVAFILDTTGSMGGELGIIKEQLMAIAHRLGNGEPAPDIRYAVVAYRDKGDIYVTKTLPFERDLGAVDGFVRGLVADAGGDGPEDVAAALHAAAALPWEAGENVDRIAFLVGDAPPHAYPREPTWQAAATALRERSVRVTTLGARALDPRARSVFASIGKTTGGISDSLTYRMATAPDGTPHKAALLQDLHVWLVDAALPAREWKRGAAELAAAGLAAPYTGPAPPLAAFVENNLDRRVAEELVGSATSRGTRYDPPTPPVALDLAQQWAAELAAASGHPPDRIALVGISRQELGACSPNDDGQPATALSALTARFPLHAEGDLCSPNWSRAVTRALEPFAMQCQQQPETCATAGPSVTDWLLSSLALLLAVVSMTVVGLSTVARWLARQGYRQTHASLVAIGFGAFCGGVVGWLVALVNECGFGSGPGRLGMSVSFLGVVLALAGALASRRQ